MLKFRALSSAGAKMMISDKCSFTDFLDAVRDTSGFETIHLTHEEATRAERLCFRGHRGKTEYDACCGEYSKQLKGFILYLRHGVKVSSIKDVDLRDFERIY
jgi:hypothetical protein